MTVDVEMYAPRASYPAVPPDADLVEEGWEVRMSDQTNKRGQHWWLYRNKRHSGRLFAEHTMKYEGGWVTQSVAREVSGLQVTIPPSSPLKGILYELAKSLIDFHIRVSEKGFVVAIPNKDYEHTAVYIYADSYGEITSVEPNYNC